MGSMQENGRLSLQGTQWYERGELHLERRLQAALLGRAIWGFEDRGAYKQ
jgi:hypothetical protein